MTAAIIALLEQLLPEIAAEAPEVISAFEKILDGATLPAFDVAAALARISAASSALSATEAADDAALKAKFPNG